MAESSYSKEKFLKAVREDRFCELSTEANAPLQDEIEALLGQPSTRLDAEAEQELKYLFLGEQAPMHGKANLQKSTQILDFFNALVMSGLLMGSGSTELDERGSLELFYSLTSSGGDNAAYPFFQTAALKKFGADQLQVRAAFLRSFEAEHFDAFYCRISSQLADKGYSSPTAMLVSISVLAQVPVPDFTAVTRLLYPMIEEGTIEFARGALHLGQVMMRAADYAKQSSHGPLFGALEYASGRGIYLRALKKLHALNGLSNNLPGSFNENEPVFPVTAQWMKQGRSESSDLSHELLEFVKNPKEKCDRTEADEIFEKIKQAYILKN